MTKYCTQCGNGDDDGAAFCSKCGAPHTNSPSTPPPGMGSPYGGSRVTLTQLDRQVLEKLKWFGILGVIAEAMGMIVPFITLGSVFTPGGMMAAPQMAAGSVATAVAVGIAGIVIGIIALFMIITAFRILLREDRREFSLPLKMLWGLLAGLILYIVAIGLIAAATFSAGTNPFMPNGSAPRFSPALGAAFAVFGLAAVALLVGIIGIIIGLWRAGTRYDETLIKVGGILMIIPYVAIVGPILVLLGASSALKKIPQS